MGRPRSELSTILHAIADHVYFQRPPSTGMEYPCVLYSRDFARVQHADNYPYRHTQRYQLTVISRDPDETVSIRAAIEALPMCVYDRWYPVNNLNYDVYKLFF